jgi:ComF family protein
VLDRPLDGPVCEACWSAVRLCRGPFCRTCGDPLASWRVISVALEQCPRCRRRQPLLQTARAAGEYEGTLRDILHALKYDGRTGIAGRLGHLLRTAGLDVLREAHSVVPVPLHPWRRLRRGFNQADALARQLGPSVVHALWRRRPTVPQTGLTAAARRRNVTGAFMLSPFVSRRSRRRWIVDRVVVLVDDVRTTGATLDACAAVLLDAGAREVRGLTVARATLVRLPAPAGRSGPGKPGATSTGR